MQEQMLGAERAEEERVVVKRSKLVEWERGVVSRAKLEQLERIERLRVRVRWVYFGALCLGVPCGISIMRLWSGLWWVSGLFTAVGLYVLHGPGRDKGD